VDERAALLDAATGRAARPFDLAAGELVRWTLFELGPGRHALLRVWHHIMSDGMSNRPLGLDLARAYGAIVAGDRAALPPPAHDYATYARLQQDPARMAAQADDVAYWQARLDGAPTLALPADFHRPRTRTLNGAVVTSHLPLADVERVKAVTRDVKTSPFALFLTAYAALLARLSGDEEVVVGTPVAGRPAGYDDVVGFFATMIACRIDLRGAPDTLTAAAETYARVREGAVHQAASVERIVEALRLPHDPARQPLFQAAFHLRTLDMVPLPLPGLAVTNVDVEPGHARFDLTLMLVDRPEGVNAYWNYAADLFERSTIERIAREYATLVRAMGREPRRALASLPLMDEPSGMAATAQGVGASTPIAGAATVHGRFAEVVARDPAARAIAPLSYAALEAASSRLAVELVARNVSPGAFVAVAREKTADLAIAWLAVLKAGAAYVPIDAGVPDERLRPMLADAKVAIAIADDALAARLERLGVAVVRPDAEAAAIAAHAPAAPAVRVDGDAPAYVIYTSGSTGRPKGVVVPHRAILGLVSGADYAPLAPSDVVAQLAPPAFDASTFEIWGPLCNGASIAPIPKSTALSPRAIAAAIEKAGVTTLFLTTALFEAVAREEPSAFARCRTVLFGGEACDPRRVEAVLRAGPPARLVHVYGPTETTTFATFHEVGAVDPRALTVPIGRPIAHAEAFVLRQDGEHCAPGEPGEIVVGGTGVALGYLDATDAEASPFFVAPVGTLPPRRLYRTGDRARRRDDGAIEFLGRVDGQVKVLGHRIELAEIEAAIARHPGVSGVACVLRGDSSDTRRVVAHVVPANPDAPPPEDLRRVLRSWLPPWMLPAEIAWVRALPLNASGKVDRRALREVAARASLEPARPAAPRYSLERDLLDRWKALLGKDDLGIRDRFFESGGSSLLAARMLDDYERDTGTPVPLSVLFASDTVAGLARAIIEDSLAGNTDIAPMNERGARTPFVYAHGDFHGGGFHSHALAKLLGSDQPIYAVHPHGLDGGGVPETIEGMANDRMRALRELRPRGPYVIGGHCNGAYIAFELARQLIDAGETVPAVIIVDAPDPDPDADPAAREALVQETIHRIAYKVPSHRTADLAHRLMRAMLAYRAQRLPTHLVCLRSENNNDSRYTDDWLSLAETSELRVIPGDHVSLVLRDGGARFGAVVRDVIDRTMAGDRSATSG
jgi:amino acid adenylation domain-containing protein